MKKAFVLAAGLGTRLKPLTDNKPKALVEVGGATLLEHCLLRLKKYGFEFVVVNIHHFGQQIIDFLQQHDNFGLQILISDEREKLLDTGGAIKKACPLFNCSPFLVHNVDIISNAELDKLYARQGENNDDSLLLVSSRESSRKLLFSNDYRLCGWSNETNGEKKLPWKEATPTNPQSFAFSGIHVFSPSLYGDMEPFGDKFSITDFYLQVCPKRKIYGVMQADLQVLDMGKPAALESPLLQDLLA